MSDATKIEWCDSTWNPWIGCERVSPGCVSCYMEVSTPVRVLVSKGEKPFGKGAARHRTGLLNEPLRWARKPVVCNLCGQAFSNLDGFEHRHGTVIPALHRRRVFVLSLGDWLDWAVPVEWLAELLDVVRRCPELDFLFLSKRVENWAHRITEATFLAARRRDADADDLASMDLSNWLNAWLAGVAPGNVWVGATVENQEYADKRIPELLMIPAVCRFVSYEPALGAIDFRFGIADCRLGEGANGLNAKTAKGAKIDWVIVGGESHRDRSKARAFDVAWARSAIAQCREARGSGSHGVACFVKQLGARPFSEMVFRDGKDGRDPVGFPLELRDPKGGDWSEWPKDLRVRQWPEVKLQIADCGLQIGKAVGS